MSVLTQSTRYSCSILKKLEFSRQIFAEYSNIKFHENPFSGSRVVLSGRTDMTKLIVALRDFVNAPKKESTIVCSYFVNLVTDNAMTIGLRILMFTEIL